MALQKWAMWHKLAQRLLLSRALALALPRRGVIVGTMHLTAQQIRAARAFLDWSQADLAEKSLVSVRTVKRVEGGGQMIAAVERALLQAFEAEGIEFMVEKGAVGVSLKLR